jgi:glycine oxidase
VKTFDVAVIGGGVIGASIAFELAGANQRVVVLDRQEPGQGASWAAAGMLSPAPDSPRDIRLVPLAKESLRLYPEFVAAIEEVSRKQTGYTREGALEIFFGTLAETQINDFVSYHRELGLATESISTDTARGWEKLISPDARAAAWLPAEGTVDPRALTGAVLAAAKNRGVEIWPNRAVRGLLVEREKCRGIAADEERISAELVIVAAGYSSNEIANGSDLLARYAPTRPVRGQMLALRPTGAVLRRVVRSKNGYLVPRKDGRIVAGSTIEEAGSEKRVTSAGIRTILNGAMELVPDLAQAEVLEMWSGLRPGTPDDLPIIGLTEIDGLLIATGHYRNGILLAPVTARLISDLILRGRTSFDADTFSPLRFSNRQVQAHAV